MAAHDENTYGAVATEIQEKKQEVKHIHGQKHNLKEAFELIPRNMRNCEQFGGWYLILYVLQEWGEKQPEVPVDWTLLFFDLIFVAVTAVFSECIADDVSTLGVKVLAFYAVIEFWQHMTLFESYFKPLGRYSNVSIKAMLGFYTVATMGMSFAGSHDFKEGNNFKNFIYYQLVGWAWVLLGAFLFGQIPRARVFMIVYGVTIAILMAVAVIFLQFVVLENWYFYAYFCTIISINYISMTCFHSRLSKEVRLPINIAHVNERYGCLIMILLGEGLTTILPNFSHNINEVSFVLAYLVQIFVFHLMYYDWQSEDIRYHAFRHSITRAQMWINSHRILIVALLVYSSAQKKLFEGVSEGTELDFKDAWFFSGSMYGMILPLCGIWFSNQFIGFGTPGGNKQLCIFAFCQPIVLWPIIAPYVIHDVLTLQWIQAVALVMMLVISYYVPQLNVRYSAEEEYEKLEEDHNYNHDPNHEYHYHHGGRTEHMRDHSDRDHDKNENIPNERSPLLAQ